MPGVLVYGSSAIRPWKDAPAPEARDCRSRIDVAGVDRIEPGTLRHDLRAHPVEGVVLEGQDRSVALPEARPVAVRVVAILLVVARIGDSRRRLRREDPVRLAAVAVVMEQGCVGRSSELVTGPDFLSFPTGSLGPAL